jgi:putative ABC transport system ATP-binding protein
VSVVATGLVKAYRTEAETVPALRGVDLAIGTGELLAVMGPSGSGKTTLLNCLSGLDRPDEGEVLIDGVALATRSGRAERDYRAATMGFLFQGSALLGALTAEENVELPLLIARRPARDARAAARGLLDQLGVGHRRGHRPDQLSGGERQRVALARAVIGRPAILWADEPTASLDSETAGGVMDCIAALHDEGLTVVVVTHDGVVAAAADRCVEVRDGRLTGVEPGVAGKPPAAG